MGTVEVGERFSINTKVVSFVPGSHTRANIAESVDTSLELLKILTANIEYLHVLDRTTPFEETVKAMNDAHKAGKFKYSGLSNFTAKEVEENMKIC
jgi:aflatoxin B1 aldehyde reductase